MKRWLLFAVPCFCLFVSLGALSAIWLPNTRPFSSLKPEQQATLAKLRSGENRLDRSMNILVLGTDVVASKEASKTGFRAATSSLDGRSDTILLAHLDPEKNKVNVLSVPRDSRFTLEGYGKRKANEANLRGGILLAAPTISQNLNDVPIDRYVRINTLGVIDLVNAVGGVRVYVPKAIKYNDDSQHLYINIAQGWQTLGGLDAQKFMRFRHDELGDIGRVQRQQQVIKALAQKVASPDVLTRLPQIVEVLKANIDTDLSLEDLLSLAQFGLRVKPDKDLQLVMLPGRFSRPGEFNASYWLPTENRIPGIVNQYFAWGDNQTNGTELKPSQIRIVLQNCSGDPTALARARKFLEKQGFTNLGKLSDQIDPIWHTEIVAQQGEKAPAELVQQELGLGDIKVEATGNILSDVTLKIGKDWAARKPKA
jgi:polyisoprenyl-teichoic acid--peptidoglycan teichoic acid transferase